MTTHIESKPRTRLWWILTTLAMTDLIGRTVIATPRVYLRTHEISDVVISLWAVLWILGTWLRILGSFANGGDNKIMRQPFLSTRASTLRWGLGLISACFAIWILGTVVYHTGKMTLWDNVDVLGGLACAAVTCLQDLRFLKNAPA